MAARSTPSSAAARRASGVAAPFRRGWLFQDSRPDIPLTDAPGDTGALHATPIDRQLGCHPPGPWADGFVLGWLDGLVSLGLCSGKVNFCRLALA